jgi:hypothetical protein
MLARPEVQDRILLGVAILAASLIQISIAASQIFLGLGIVLLLVFRQKLPFPRIWIPLAFFFFWTALADVLSPDPWGGRAQLKKFFVFFFHSVDLRGLRAAVFESLLAHGGLDGCGVCVRNLGLSSIWFQIRDR